jgi:chemotaxis protein MotB
MRHVLLLALAGSMMNGCVALDKYNALKLERDRYLERLGQAESEARAEREKAKILQDQLNGLLGAGTDSQNLLQTLQKQNSDLRAQLDEVNRKYQEALRSGRPVIPQEVSNELADLAKQNPDILEYDAQRGMLKFKSDVTFASGSSEVTAKAQDVLKKVAQILNSSSVASYELLVVGHTDNVPVSQPRTIQAGHKDNWYLSAHRAITVGAELRKDGIATNRMGVAGYADQRPVASNATEAGKAQNRRVEIMILPAPKTNAGATAAPAETTPAAAPAPVEINK